jgi:hypothetical protein
LEEPHFYFGPLIKMDFFNSKQSILNFHTNSYIISKIID